MKTLMCQFLIYCCFHMCRCGACVCLYQHACDCACGYMCTCACESQRLMLGLSLSSPLSLNILLLMWVYWLGMVGQQDLGICFYLPLQHQGYNMGWLLLAFHLGSDLILRLVCGKTLSTDLLSQLPNSYFKHNDTGRKTQSMKWYCVNVN